MGGRGTPLKRLRSPPGRMSFDHVLSPPCDALDDAALDNVRSQKRYLSEAMATDLRRLNVASGEEPCSSRGASSPSLCSMQTDRDSICGSPALSDCFNPFDSPGVPSRGPSRRLSGSPINASGIHPSTSPVKPHWLPGAGSGGGSGWQGSAAQGSPMHQGTTPARCGHLSRCGAALDAGERLPPSPSDPQLGMDLRRTALLRSMLLRTEEKVNSTPGVTMRRRSRMSDVMHRSAPSLPFTSRISGRGGPLDGAAEMDMAESPGSDEDCGREEESLKLGAIFSFSEEAEESMREHASLILGEASRQSRDSYETVVCFPHVQ